MHCDYQTRDDARVSLFDYMEVFYNRQRRHSSISYQAPLPFEAMKSPGKVSTVRGEDQFATFAKVRLYGVFGVLLKQWRCRGGGAKVRICSLRRDRHQKVPPTHTAKRR